MLPRLSRVATTAVIGAVFALTGCGGGSSPSSSENPTTEFRGAFSALRDGSVLTTTLHLDTSGSDLQRFASEHDGKLSADDAAAIASAQVVIEVQSADGGNLSDVKSGDSNAANSSFRAGANGKTLIEFRTVKGALYLHGDVQGILDLFHQSGSFAQVQAQVSQMPPFIQALVRGDWISMDSDAAKSLAGQFSGGATPSDQQRQQLLDKLQQIIDNDVTITRAGSDDKGDHLVLSGHTRKLATDIISSFSSLVPGGGAALGQFDPNDIEDKTIKVDAWVKDGVLSEISLDIVQFAPSGQAKPGEHLPVALTFSKDGADIEQPSGATPIDLTQLGSLLGGLGA
jgi:hypothetical protein